jgi:C4-dicarboxylate-specific signal transduction histidine kinase
VLGIARDITEQKEERERAARADKLRALGQLASGVAHDFNNSLARFSDAHSCCDVRSTIRRWSVISTSFKLPLKMRGHVRRIQTFARKSAVKEFELVDVASLLNDAVEIHGRAGKTKRVFAGSNMRSNSTLEKGQYTMAVRRAARSVVT